MTWIDWSEWPSAVTSPLAWMTIFYLMITVIVTYKATAPGAQLMFLGAGVSFCCTLVSLCLFAMDTDMITVDKTDDDVNNR